MKMNEVSWGGIPICNIIRVINIQQEAQDMTGSSVGYSNAKELFCVYTDDGRFEKLYRHNEADKIVNDLFAAGYITYAMYYSNVSVTTKLGPTLVEGNKVLRQILRKHLISLSNYDYSGICYSREELAWYKKELCVIHGGVMHWKGEDIPAFQYRDTESHRVFKIDKCIGNSGLFKKELNLYMNGFPLVQLIFAYYLSGAIRQILVNVSEGIGEYGLVACITGKTGSGKTTVTTTLQNILFGKGRMVSNNVL